MAKRIPKNFGKDSKLQAMRVSASTLITDTIEELQSRYENKGVSEQTLRAIAPLVEEGEDPDVLLARQDFDFFCTKISSVFKPTLHHQVWNRSLITEESNKYLHRIAGQNTSILSPRGSAKSTKLGLFCAWAIGIHAEQQMALQMLYISANRELALAKSETIRNVISSDGYQKIFPFVQPHPKKWASPLWSIDRTAAGIETTGQEEFTCIAAGILGTIASKRCFTGDTNIETNYGTIKIKDAKNYSDLKVKSYNHGISAVEYRPVRAFSESRAKGLVEITTSGGCRLSCTSDHPVYTLQRGYTEAGSLVPGDTVIRLASQESVKKQSSELFKVSRVNKDSQSRLSLQKVLLGDKGDYCEGAVPALQKDIRTESGGDVWKNKRWMRQLLLLKQVLQRFQVCGDVKRKAVQTMWRGSFTSDIELQQEVLRFLPKAKADRTAYSEQYCLPNLQKRVLLFIKETKVLLSSLLRQGTQQANDRKRQQSLQAWQQLRQVVSSTASTDFGKRQQPVCDVQSRKCKRSKLDWQASGDSKNTSHRSQSTEQCSREPNQPVQSVPHKASHYHPKWEYDTISTVERISDDYNTVYDIQVEGNSNFFANEILAHNCNLIIYDDLIKNAEDIASPSVRRKMVRTHYSVVMPTLFPGGRILAINTRYRPDDIHVTDFIPTKGWNVLEQSAIIPRRELIRLGTFKEGVSKVTAVSSEALDEEEAIKMARQEETRLALQRAIKQASSKKDGSVEDDTLNGDSSSPTPSPKDNVLSSFSFSSSPFSEQAIQLSEQLQSIKEYGVDVKAVTDFDTEEEWEEYLDEEVSYWEAMWSLSYLQGRRTADATSFVYQYQNKVEQAEGQGIPPEHIKYGRPPAQYDYFCIGGDLATSKSNKADYTVFCLVGKADSQYWVLDYWRGKVTGNLQKIEHILDLYENWADDPLAGSITPWRVALEKVSYQASISDDLTRELYHKRMLSNIVVSPTQLKGGKEAHMASITGAFANGLVTFNEGIEWGPFVEELQGLGAHDDCVDALVIALQTLGVRRRLATVDTEEELLKLQSHYELNHFASPYTDPYHGHWV